MKTNSNNPTLRFPGFTDDWEEKKLSDVFVRITTKNTENDKNVLTISAQYGLISQLDFFKKSVASSDVTGYYLLKKGEFAYNKSTSQGRPVGAIKPLKLYDKGVVSTLYICFKCKNPEEIAFWEQYFDAGILDSEIQQIAQEGARNHGLLNISTSDFFNLKIKSPSLPEQQKIASCLSSIDDEITAEQSRLDALTSHKKGLMQQLFPQEGQTTPSLRFPGFSNEWQVKILGDIASFSKGKGISKEDISENGQIPCIRYGELYTHYKECITEIISYTNLPQKDLVFSKANDVIIPSSGETQEDIATASCVTKANVALGSDLNIIRSHNNGIFLSYYLNSAKRYEIAQMSQGFSVVHLYNDKLKKLTLSLPTLPEQQKIAECLSSIDNEIAAQQSRIDALKQHKQGLMQQLFPNANK